MYVEKVETIVEAQAQSSKHIDVDTWENYVNICRMVYTNPVPRIENGQVPRPPDFCKSEVSK